MAAPLSAFVISAQEKGYIYAARVTVGGIEGKLIQHT